MAATLPAAAPSPVEGDRRRWLALIVVCAAMLMNALDASIVNVALPSIQEDLGFSQADLSWIINAYLIAFGSFLLLAGRLGDLVGRRRVFLAGTLLFTLASLLCGVADSQGMLIVGRFLQGVGGAVSTSVIIALIAVEFPAPAERAKAMSAYVFVAISGGSIGLLLGGLLTESINWHWIFFINLPIGVVVLALGRILLPDDGHSGLREGVDWAGSVLITGATMVGIYAIIGTSDHGWGSARTLGLLALTAVLVIAFVVLESRLRNPIMPPRILRLPGLLSSSFVRATLASTMFGTFFLGALYLERVRGFSPLQIGLAFMPMTIVVGAFSAGITARLMGRFGAYRTMLPGIVCGVVGLLLLASAGEHTAYFPTVFFGYALMGVGMGTAFMPLLTIAMAQVPPADAGISSGVVNVSMQIAGALGLAILSTVAATHTRHLVEGGDDAVAALTGGYQLAFLVAAGLNVLGGVLAVTLLRAHRHHGT